MASQYELPAVDGEILPGRFLIADVYAVERMFNGLIGSYWPALVVDKSWAPLKVERRQNFSPLNRCSVKPKEEYLIWLVGKNKFFWVERSHLRQLHESQLEAIKDLEDEEEFTSLFQIGMNQSIAENLEMFGDQIMDDAARINGADSVLTPGVPCSAELPRRGSKRPFENHPTDRNLRARTGDSSAPSGSSASTGLGRTPSTSISRDTMCASVVKQEPNEDDLLPRDERVQILVGPINTEFTCSRTNIAKSPVLSSYVVEHPGQHPYIMNPALKDICPGDFGCLIEFLRTNMYAPALVEAPASRIDLRNCGLEGLASEKEYTNEIQRCGRIHVLAKKFQITSLVDFVYMRLTNVRYPAPVDRRVVLLELTKTVFSEKAVSNNVNAAAQGQDQEDALETWLVMNIVERLDIITTNRDSSKLFWEVMQAGKATGLAAKVFRGRAELEEKLPDAIKIEDD